MLHLAFPYKLAALTAASIGAALEIVAFQLGPTTEWALANVTAWIAIGGGFAVFGGLKTSVRRLEKDVGDKADAKAVVASEERTEKRFDKLERMISDLDEKIDRALPKRVGGK